MEGFNVAGKTGTSQIVQRKEGKPEPTSPELQDHALFACFAPALNPEIVVVVLVEHGGGGGAAAAPVAKQVLETYHQRGKRTPPSPARIAAQPSATGADEG